MGGVVSPREIEAVAWFNVAEQSRFFLVPGGVGESVGGSRSAGTHGLVVRAYAFGGESRKLRSRPFLTSEDI